MPPNIAKDNVRISEDVSSMIYEETERSGLDGDNHIEVYILVLLPVEIRHEFVIRLFADAVVVETFGEDFNWLLQIAECLTKDAVLRLPKGRPRAIRIKQQNVLYRLLF